MVVSAGQVGVLLGALVLTAQPAYAESIYDANGCDKTNFCSGPYPSESACMAAKRNNSPKEVDQSSSCHTPRANQWFYGFRPKHTGSARAQ